MGWEGLSEKQELIDKLMKSFADSMTTPTFAANLEFQASDQGIVDLLIDDSKLYSGGWGGTIKIYQIAASPSLTSVTQIGTMPGHMHATNALRKFSPETLLSSGSDGCVRGFDVTTLQEIEIHRISNEWIWSLEMARAGDPNEFFTGSVDHLIRRHDRRSGKITQQTLLPAEVAGLSISHCNGLIAAACFDGCVRLYDDRSIKMPLLAKRLCNERLARTFISDKDVICGSFTGRVYSLNYEESIGF